jgi:nucleotide-binding universal stress UspA family protein
MQPFRTILFATDFSENSKQAFGAASSLALGNQTRLVVLHVAEPNWTSDQPVYYGQQSVQFHAAQPSEVEQQSAMQRMGELYIPNQPMQMEYIATQGDPAEEILRKARELSSDLIVTGTHGRTGLRRMLAGSVAVSVLRGAPCPVLALRSVEKARKTNEIRVILHPTDFSVDSEAALRVARWLARDHGARLIVLHVAVFEDLLAGTPVAEIDPRLDREALEDVRKRVEGPDLKHRVESLLRRGYAADGILQTAEEVSCDLIVMGTNGRTGLSRLLMGSVAEHVLAKADCAVLVAKGGQPVSARSADRVESEALSVHWKLDPLNAASGPLNHEDSTRNRQ